MNGFHKIPRYEPIECEVWLQAIQKRSELHVNFVQKNIGSLSAPRLW